MAWLRWEYFERAVAFLLTVGMGAVIFLAVWHLGVGLFGSVRGYDAGFAYGDFQDLFDRVLAALIALELAHSVQQIAAGRGGLVQVRTVVLIGLLAVVRKLILLEVETTSGAFLAGLAAAIFALGAVYAVMTWVEQVDPRQRGLLSRDDDGQTRDE